MVKWNDNFYRWDKTFSRQTGTNGEICIVTGGKGIGKTFGLRAQCVEDFIRKGELFCEICRTKDETAMVEEGYFSKLQSEGLFKDYAFKIEKNCGYISKNTNEAEWSLICYFVSLTAFQTEKKRTFVKPNRFIFDEAIIDRKDRYHRYLKNEFLVLANLLDSISRQQPDDGYHYKVYLLGNACDLTCPYLSELGINKIPEYGYHWFKNKTVLFHYAEPINAEERKVKTLVGRMLAGNKESEMIFDNKFADTSNGEVAKKTSNAKFAYALIFDQNKFAIWIDYKNGIFYINSKIPKGEKNIYTLTKKDSSINYQMVKKTDYLLQMLIKIYYINGLRYESVGLRERFLSVLDFLGIH